MLNPNALRAGTVIGDYEIERVLGAGGFGITYRARDVRLDAKVAIKEYFPSSLARRRSDQTVEPLGMSSDEAYNWGLDKFRNEAMTLAKLPHSNIVGVNRLMQDLNTFYMVLDYIEGPSWKDWLRNLKRWPQQGELDQLLFPLLEALEVVHAKQLLHRDIAPKNIMLAKPFTPILIDFGAARQLVAQRSQTFAALLTPGYAPFEQYVATGAGQGPWTDLYGLAATLYESIAGRTPPDAPERALEDKIVPAVEVGGQHYRRDFLEAIDWALKPLPKQRPQSVEEWRWKLLEHQQQLTTTAPQRASLAAPGTAAETAKRAATPNWSWSRVSQWWTGKEPGKS